MFPIIMDVHEPQEVELYLKKTMLVIRKPNEPAGFADYYWNSGDALIMVERKKAGELVSAIGNRLDAQLVKYRTQHPDSIVVILQEGLVTPTKENKCQFWEMVHYKNRKNPTWRTTRHSPFEYTAYRSYLYSRMMEGTPVVHTMNEQDTALVLASMVYNSMKVSHSQLKDMVPVRRRQQKGETQEFNSQMRLLLSFKGIGEKKATDLLKRHGSPWEIFRMPYELLADMEGERVADILTKGIGK